MGQPCVDYGSGTAEQVDVGWRHASGVPESGYVLGYPPVIPLATSLFRITDTLPSLIETGFGCVHVGQLVECHLQVGWQPA